MENRSGKSGIYTGKRVKESNKIFDRARAARSNDRHVSDLADRTEHFNIKSTADAIGIDRIDNDLARAVSDTALDPFNGVDARIDSSAVFEKPERSVNALDISAENNALTAVAFSRAGDEIGIADRARVYADLVCAAFKNAVEIIKRADTAAYCKRNKNLRRHSSECIGEQLSAVGRSGYIVENELVRAAIAVKFGKNL